MNGLGDKVRSTSGECPIDRGVIVKTGDQQTRATLAVRLLLQPLAYLKAVHTRHHGIQQEHVRLVLDEFRHGRLAIRCLDDPVSVALECAAQHQTHDAMVVDDEQNRRLTDARVYVHAASLSSAVSCNAAAEAATAARWEATTVGTS